MKYLRNPVTGEVKHASPLEAKRLHRYGWTYCKRDKWIEYQRAQVHAVMIKTMPSAAKVLGRLQ